MSVPHTANRAGALLRQIREDLEHVAFPLAVRGRIDGLETRDDVVHQLDDYMLPRYEHLDAPLLAVFGGSTGAGKSTLINALVRGHIASASAIRPTTRRPLLVHNPADAEWFNDQRILPSLARVAGADTFDSALASGSNGEITEIGLRASAAIPQGLAVLDSPDIDSVVVENRALAAQLLAAADLWVFVTTAARYADAIPWAMLDDAASRNIVVAVVLNRVPAGVGAQVRADLAARLAERGLQSAPLFVISEQELDDEGFLHNSDIEGIRGWLEGIARDAGARAAVVRQTLAGAIDQLVPSLATIGDAYRGQLETRDALEWDARRAFDVAVDRVDSAVADGTLLRGEVLARWQDVVGTGEWARKLETGVARLRDRIAGFFTASTVETDDVEVAIQDGLHTLIVGETESAIGAALEAWERVGALDIAVVRSRLRDNETRAATAAQLVREWQQGLLDMIRDEGAAKKSTARALALGVNAIGVALIIVVFASTGGLLGGEVAVAGGTAVVAQRLLEAVFGDDAVRRMARQATKDLHERVVQFVDVDRAVFHAVLDELELDAHMIDALGRRIRDLDACEVV